MLANLFVSDLALIRNLSVDFGKGFSVLTGETGAGKSLVLDSLNLFLEQKGAKDLVRHGAEQLEASLFFDEISPFACGALSEFLPPEEIQEGICLSRVVTKEGKSIQKCNGRSMPFSQIRRIASTLLAIHGQQSAGGLLDEKNHRVYLDEALPSEGKQCLAEYRSLWEAYTENEKELARMESEVGQAKEKIDLYTYQLNEIAKVKPKLGEEEALEQRLAALQNAEKFHGAISVAHRALSGGEKGRGAFFLLEAAAAKLDVLGKDHPLSSHAEELYEMARRTKEIAGEVSFAFSQEEEDPGDLMDRIRRRIDALYQLKLKYGSTVEEVLAFYEETKRKKDSTEQLKDDIKIRLAKKADLTAKLEETAGHLTAAREAVARQLEEEIHSVLAFLDMPKMRFFVSLEPGSLSPWGKEAVSFRISPNTGEGKRPLSQIASGGELSRIMLALQLKLGSSKDADTVIFDEIDTGISGATSQKIGICLRELAQEKQVFCVTHSAQVSTLAKEHFLVEKREEEGRTETVLTLLGEEESLRENARLLGGAALTPQALSAAGTLREEGIAEWNKQQGLIF
jgi:DNA repair protein RecN (Recombination protein N)